MEQDLAVPSDVTDETSAEKAVDEALRTRGPCGFLINGAGGNNKAVTMNSQHMPEEISKQKIVDMVGF